jgi:hypothetical protein
MTRCERRPTASCRKCKARSLPIAVTSKARRSSMAYRCPAGQRAIWRFTTVESGLTIHKYCPQLALSVRSKRTARPARTGTGALPAASTKMHSTGCKIACTAHRRLRECGRPSSIPSALSKRGWGQRTSRLRRCRVSARRCSACVGLQPETRSADRRYRAAHASDQGMNVLFCLKIPHATQ